MLSWKVYIADINKDEIVEYDIFKHSRFFQDCIKNKSHNKDKQTFTEQLEADLCYWFWSKNEWEIVLDCFPPLTYFKSEKVDVYKQVMMNWEVFSNYVWNNI